VVDLIGENGDGIVPVACFGQVMRLAWPAILHGWHRLCPYMFRSLDRRTC
jgi:hypothetical protein